MFKALQAAADRVQTWWSLWLLVGGTGVVTAAVANATSWLAPWGAIGWWSAFLIGCLAAALIFATFSWGYGRWARDRDLRKVLASTGVNPLTDRFEKQTILAADLYNRDYVPHVNKSFRDCYISGPAMVLLDGCTLERVDFRHCQIALLNPQIMLYGAIKLDRCLFAGGVMSNLTLLMSPQDFAAMPADFKKHLVVIAGNA